MNQNVQLINYFHRVKASSTPSDLTLIRQIAMKNQVALEELYHRYHQMLYYFFLKTTQEQTSAEDLLQECFLNIWEAADKFEERSSVKTWLLRIAYFMSAGWLRNNKIVLQDIENEAIELIDDQQNESIESQVFLKWNISQIQKAVEELSPLHREVVAFTFTYGLTSTELAYILECPVGTVKSRLWSALRQLNRILCAKGILR